MEPEEEMTTLVDPNPPSCVAPPSPPPPVHVPLVQSLPVVVRLWQGVPPPP